MHQEAYGGSAKIGSEYLVSPAPCKAMGLAPLDLLRMRTCHQKKASRDPARSRPWTGHGTLLCTGCYFLRFSKCNHDPRQHGRDRKNKSRRNTFLSVARCKAGTVYLTENGWRHLYLEVYSVSYKRTRS